jgi:two-component system, chemotaxis family, protein-glutamate methylesterase/glutaminase
VAGRDIVVVGASAGGVEALRKLAETLPRELPAAVFVVLHIPPTDTSVLPDILHRAGRLPAKHASDREPVVAGRIYVAPPDFHMLLEAGTVRVVRGPRENGHRPAVDTLFRSAAAVYGPRVMGVVLSGTLDDGSDGLRTIKARGGLAVVQDPEEAIYPDMPANARSHADPQHCLRIVQIGELIAEVARGAGPVLREESMEDTHTAYDSIEEATNELGPPTALTCPECGGALWDVTEGGLVRFRCHVGHTFSAASVLTQQAGDLERSLWTAVRALQERATMARRVARRMRAAAHSTRRLEDQARRAEADADRIRSVIGHLEALPELTVDVEQAASDAR